MKHLLLTTIAAVVLVGCATTQSPEPLISKAPDISIHEAVAAGNIEAVKQHLADGADVNATDEVGWTPLHRAVIGSHTDHTETAEFLIASGADVNARNAIGWTPLFYAAAKTGSGHKEIGELLIASDADVNALSVNGKTPLDLANDEIADLLRKHGGKTGGELKAEGK
jgi:ankyrin repeat protein